MLAWRWTGKSAPAVFAQVERIGDPCEHTGASHAPDDVQPSADHCRPRGGTRRWRRRKTTPACPRQDVRRSQRSTRAVTTYDVEPATVRGRHRMIHGDR